jgi:hypothetical protein
MLKMTSNGWEAINFWNMALSGALSNFRNQGDWNGHNDGDWNNSGVPVRSQIWIVSNNLITSQIRRIATMHSTAKTWKPNRSAIMIYRFGIFWNFWSWKTKRKTASPWHYKLSNWGLVLEPISIYIYIYTLPPFSFTCHQTFTVSILTICLLLQKIF